MSYKYRTFHNPSISFFELNPDIRYSFALRMATSVLSYLFLALSLSVEGHIGVKVSALAVCLPFVRLFGTSSRPGKLMKIALCLTTVIGWALMLVGMDKSYFSVLASIFFSIACVLTFKTKVMINHSIDTIYTALAMTLISPSFVFSDYSLHPAKLSIDRSEVLYYIVSGTTFWLFHANFSRLMC